MAQWLGNVPKRDDFGDPIKYEFIDGKTRHGPWAIMSPRSWQREGIGKFGTGLAQCYRRQDDGKWLKIKG